jgi:hypothetical protein
METTKKSKQVTIKNCQNMHITFVYSMEIDEKPLQTFLERIKWLITGKVNIK